jgi:hypothetical protein
MLFEIGFLAMYALSFVCGGVLVMMYYDSKNYHLNKIIDKRWEFERSYHNKDY